MTTSRTPGRESHLVPVGPIDVHVLVGGSTRVQVTSRVTGNEVVAAATDGYLESRIDQVHDHELIVIDGVETVEPRSGWRTGRLSASRTNRR